MVDNNQNDNESNDSERTEPFKKLVITLDEQIHSDHGGIKTFRAVERCEYDDRTQFFGVNIDGVSVIEVDRDNIRSVVYERDNRSQDTGNDQEGT